MCVWQSIALRTEVEEDFPCVLTLPALGGGGVGSWVLVLDFFFSIYFCKDFENVYLCLSTHDI